MSSSHRLENSNLCISFSNFIFGLSSILKRKKWFAVFEWHWRRKNWQRFFEEIWESSMNIKQAFISGFINLFCTVWYSKQFLSNLSLMVFLKSEKLAAVEWFILNSISRKGMLEGEMKLLPFAFKALSVQNCGWVSYDQREWITT